LTLHIPHLHCTGRGGCLLERIGHYDCNVLAVVRDDVVVERRASFVDSWSEADAIELSDVFACEDSPDPWHLRGNGRVQLIDPSLGDCRANRYGVKHLWKVEIRRIRRRTADLKRSVNSGKVAADDWLRFVAC
jgi:hypothetical protein